MDAFWKGRDGEPIPNKDGQPRRMVSVGVKDSGQDDVSSPASLSRSADLLPSKAKATSMVALHKDTKRIGEISARLRTRNKT